LQAVAEPGQVVVSAATSAALPKDVELGGLGRRDVKGRDEPIEAYVVLS
jgi:class 3 adenylate cyclase